MARKKMNLIERQLAQYPWLWAISSSWRDSDEVHELEISTQVLSSPYDAQVLWWMLIDLPEYKAVMDIDSELLIDESGQRISTVAHRVLHQLAWNYRGYNGSIPVAYLVSQKISYGSDPSNPCVVFRPEKNRLMMDLICQVHGVESYMAFREQVINGPKHAMSRNVVSF